MLSIVLTIVAAVVMVAFVVGIAIFTWRSQRSRYRVSPDVLGDGVHLTDPEQRAEWLASGRAGSTAKEQLRTLDALRADGLISQEEWEVTRMAIVKTL